MTQRPLSRLSLIFVIAAVVPVLRAQPVAVPLAEEIFPQLKPILTQAVAQSPQMLQRNLDVAQAEAARLQSVSSLYPSLSGGFSYSINTSAVAQDPNGRSRSDGLFYNFGLNQPLFHWGTLKAQADASKIGLEIAQRNFAEAYRTLVLSLRAQYLALVVKHQQVQNARFALQNAQSIAAVAEEKARIGQISSGEAINPRLAVDEAALLLDRAEADFELSKRIFSRVAGIPQITDQQIPIEIPLGQDYYDPNAGAPYLSRFELGGGLEETFQAQNIKASIAQADLNYKVAKYRLFPKINLGAGFVQSNSTSVIGNTVTQSAVQSQSASISAFWTIFDGFATKGAKLSALTTKRTYERQLASYLEATADQARDQQKQIGFAARAMRLADTRRELVNSAVKAATEDLQRGVGSQTAVDAATLAYHNARIVATSARADYLNRWSDFASLIGVDPALENLPSDFRHVRK